MEQSKQLSMEQLSISVPCISVLTARIFPEVLLFSKRSVFKHVVLNHYKFEFLQHELSSKKNSCSGVLRWRTIDFVRCIRFLVVQFFQRNILSIIVFHIQIYPPLSPISTGLISIKNSSMKKPFSCKNILDGNIVAFRSLHWKTDFPTFQIRLFRMFHLDIETANSP